MVMRRRQLLPAFLAFLAAAAAGVQLARGQASRPATRTTATAPTSTQPVTGGGEPRTGPFFRGDGGPGETNLPVGGNSEMLWHMMASVLVLAVLALVAWVVFKKVLPRVSRAGGRNVSVLETSYIGPRKAVHLLRVGQKRLLVASSRDDVSLLADVTEAVEQPSQPFTESGAGDGS